MRLIDADTLTDCVHDVMSVFKELNEDDYRHIADKQPTIDAMPVVRCKECKHRAEWNGAYGCGLDGCFGDRYTDGFCDRAERRDDEID